MAGFGAVGKPRGKKGMLPVYVYVKAERKKKYVGSAEGVRAANKLGMEKYLELNGEQSSSSCGVITCREYGEEWLELHHGVGTKRPAPATHRDNKGKLQQFFRDFADRALDGGVTRREALAWSKQHPGNARVVSAMFNDAINDEVCKGNPFANRRQESSRERKHIHPLTEEEVARLADIASRQWGPDGYGRIARAFVLFGAWVGCRPGETFRVSLVDCDFERSEVKIKRVKKRGGRYPTDTVVLPAHASDAIRAMDIPGSGPIFRTVHGKPFVKGALKYYWDPIRAAFRETVTDKRWEELLDGTEDGKNLDFYALRHFCASQIVNNGGNEYDVSAQLGNSPEVARETYIHQYQDDRNQRNRQFLEGGKVIWLERKDA